MHLPIVTTLPKDTNSLIRAYQETFIETDCLFETPYLSKYFRLKTLNMVNLLKVLLAILNQVHEYACQTAFENTQESLHFSRELILFHAVLRPPFSIEVFTPNEAKLANQYMDENYFR